MGPIYEATTYASPARCTLAHSLCGARADPSHDPLYYAAGLRPRIFPRQSMISVVDFIAEHDSTPSFLVDPYVPRGGIIFLYGKTSIGKSPLSWELARCVAAGVPWMGCPTHQGTVLYIDVDTPAPLVRERIRRLPQPLPPSWYVCFLSPFNVLDPRSARPLMDETATLQPALVIVNTLRKVHYSDDKESHVPSRVYGAFRALFPHAALWFNHHDKKTGDPAVQLDPDEAFSGTQAWLNDATVGLHLMPSRQGAGMLQLVLTKSQVSAKRPPLIMRLADDGTTIASYDRMAEIQTLFAKMKACDPSLSDRQVCLNVGAELGLGLSTVQRWVSQVAQNK